MAFSVNADGIVEVSASDRGSNRTESITITNDQSRLSKDEIERMMRDFEKFKAQDEAAAQKVEARNGFDSFLYQTKNQLNGEVGGKLEASDKEMLLGKIEEAMRWTESHTSASVEEYEQKKKEIEQVLHPVMSKVYSASGATAGEPGVAPRVEEVDD